jgi:hypothetical protein
MEKDQKDDVDRTTPSYSVTHLGVWRILIAKSGLNLPGKDWKNSFSVFPVLLIFIAEIYALAPDLVVFFVLTKVWSGIQSSLLLRTSNHLLTVVSNDRPLDRLVLILTSAFSSS